MQRPHRLGIFLKKCLLWMKGPPRPRRHLIRPWYPNIQRAPVVFFNRLAPHNWIKCFIFGTVFLLWLGLFGTLATRYLSPVQTAQFGNARVLTCASTPWPNDGVSCDVDGVKCLPYGNMSFAFQCPQRCAEISIGDARTIGNQSVQYRTLVIGGGNASVDEPTSYYRGDSFVCASAIHAGIIRNDLGGCGAITITGQKSRYPSVQQNGIESIGFESSFPVSFTISGLDDPTVRCNERSPWPIFSLSLVFTLFISVFATSMAFFYFSVFTIGYFQVALISNPPSIEDPLFAVQYAVQLFLPTLFIAFVIYHVCVRRCLSDLDAQVEKTVFWLGTFWFGALENYTLDRLPLQRLTARDFAQPGAIVVLVIIIIIIVLGGIVQAWTLWSEGKLRRFIGTYVTLACCLGILSGIPSFNLRIHHYILALLLLPATALQTRPSLLFQGFLVGLFINGVARWGYASILETEGSLSGTISSAIPIVQPPMIEGSNINFTVVDIPLFWDGVIMLVNDVERARGVRAHGSALLAWTRALQEPLYFKFAYFRLSLFDGLLRAEYSKPGTWQENGSWTEWMS